MRLFLIRHAIAEPRGAKADAARALTAKGRERFEKVVRGLNALGTRFDAIWTSPMRRATETAEMLRRLLDGGGAVGETELLAGPPAPALLRLARRGEIAFVGHAPWLNELAGWLCCGLESAGGIDLKKGGMAVLDGTPKPGGMTLQLLLTPKVLRKIR